MGDESGGLGLDLGGRAARIWSTSSGVASPSPPATRSAAARAAPAGHPPEANASAEQRASGTTDGCPIRQAAAASVSASRATISGPNGRPASGSSGSNPTSAPDRYEADRLEQDRQALGATVVGTMGQPERLPGERGALVQRTALQRPGSRVLQGSDRPVGSGILRSSQVQLPRFRISALAISRVSDPRPVSRHP